MTERASALSLAFRNVLFTLVVPVSGAVLLPGWVMGRFDSKAAATAWPAVGVIAFGVALYVWCLWLFASVGRGTPVRGTRPGASSPWVPIGGCATPSTSRRSSSSWEKLGCSFRRRSSRMRAR